MYVNRLHSASCRASARPPLPLVRRASRQCCGRRRARRDWVLSDLPGVSRKHFHIGNHRSRRESEGYFNRSIRSRSPSDVRECVPVPPWHAARAWFVLGACPDRRDDAISDMAALRRGTLPRQEPTRIYRIQETGPTSSGAIRVVVESVALGLGCSGRPDARR